ncbi:protein ENHANCED PSEUDOMONAS SUSCEPTIBILITY 1-like [Triticum urartu]|uniref:protein ENHANCED PSEUDOMONAS SUSCEPTIBILITY 1-like n=1 Tax=Triticum urartu TaxID=4572 RepID=UPI0020447D66|nr:protein ENHANCED PSEUDOMONAS SUSCEPTIBILITY 1-like [Triticum urartu]
MVHGSNPVIRETRAKVEVAAQSQSLAISLRCNGEGVEFVHAVAPGITVADVTASLVVPRVVWSILPLYSRVKNFNEISHISVGLLGADAAVGSRPVVAAQVTELADGILIAVSMDHVLADGTAFWQFFNTWSELSHANNAGAGYDVMISTSLPVFDRSFLGSCWAVPIALPFCIWRMSPPGNAVGESHRQVHRPRYRRQGPGQGGMAPEQDRCVV